MNVKTTSRTYSGIILYGGMMAVVLFIASYYIYALTASMVAAWGVLIGLAGTFTAGFFGVVFLVVETVRWFKARKRKMKTA